MTKIQTLAFAALASLFAHVAVAQDGAEGAYVGILPCADCPGVEVRVDLFADGAFHQRSVYQGGGSGFDAIGRWEQDDQRVRLSYQNGDSAQLDYDDGSLTLLDDEGQRIDSHHNHTLHRSARLSPVEPRVRLEGHFTYFADSATLEDCTTKRQMPVAMQGEYIRLERAWGHAGATRERPLPVAVYGRIVQRVNMEGPVRSTLIVEKLLSAGTPVACSPKAAAGLYGTRWTLLQLGYESVAAADAERAAHIIFTDGVPTRVAGSTGCNRFNGNATLTGGSVLFGALASTKMACFDGWVREQDFLAALEGSRSWRIRDGQLELLDAVGRTTAVFVAR